MGKILLVLLVTVVILSGTLYIVLQKCCNGPSESARDLFVTTILETGQLKFLASWVCSEEEIQVVVNQNSMSKMDTSVDTSLISIGGSGNTGTEGTDSTGGNAAGEKENSGTENSAGTSSEEEFDANGAGMTLESKEDRAEAYLSRISDTKVYGCEKDKTSYLTESPVYDITADGVTVAKVTLAGTNERT